MKAKRVTDGYLKRQQLKAAAAKKFKKSANDNDPTKEKLPDGTRKYKMFKTTDEESEEAIKMARFLLRLIDRNMLDAMTYVATDEEGNKKDAELLIYARDDDKGDFIFSISTAYVTKEDVREENDSLNEGSSNNNSKED